MVRQRPKAGPGGEQRRGGVIALRRELCGRRETGRDGWSLRRDLAAQAGLRAVRQGGQPRIGGDVLRGGR